MPYTQDQLKTTLIDFHRDRGLGGECTIDFINWGIEKGYKLEAEFTHKGKAWGISIGYSTGNPEYPVHKPFHYTSVPHPTDEDEPPCPAPTPALDYKSMTDQQLTEALHKAIADNNAALTSECADHSRIAQTCIANEFNNRGRDAHVELVGVDSDCECDLHRAIRNENHPSITQYSMRMTKAYRDDETPCPAPTPQSTNKLTRAESKKRVRANIKASQTNSEIIPCPVCGKELDRKNPEGFTYSDGENGWRCTHSNDIAVLH